MEESRPTPSVVLAAYAQSFVEGRRVVIFGDCTSGLAETLIERGARLVHVYDGDLSRVTEASARGSLPNVAYAPLGQSGVVVRDGTFDVGIVENLAAADDAPALITRLRRALAARGVAFVATPNLEVEPVFLADPERSETGPSYYELFELVSAEFSEVRMIGQTPFLGYALAEFGAESNQFSIDTGFVPGGAEEPEWYLAAAGHFPLSVDAFSVIQLPAEDVLGGTPAAPSLPAVPRAAPAPNREPELAALKLELEKRDAWASELEARSGAADERADQAESRIESLEAEAVALKAEVRALRDALAQRKAEASASAPRGELEAALTRQAESEAQRAALETRRAELETRCAELESALKRAHGELERAHDTARQRDQELERAQGMARQRDQEAARAREQQAARKDEAEAARKQAQDAARDELRTMRETHSELQIDFDQLEEQLRERGRALDALRRDLQKTESLTRELLVELEEAKAVSGSGDPRSALPIPEPAAGTARSLELEQRIAELARIDALRVADLTAAQWSVQELEAKLAEVETNSQSEIERLRHELEAKSTLLEQLRPTHLDA
jgi:hypothetical protein